MGKKIRQALVNLGLLALLASGSFMASLDDASDQAVAATVK